MRVGFLGRRGDWPRGGLSFLAGCLVSVVAVCGLGGVGVFVAASLTGVGSELSGLVPVVQLAAVVAVVVGGHAATCVWWYRRRPGRVEVAASQAPYLLGYVAIAVWWSASWSVWLVVWAVVAAVAVSWLLVWYRLGDRTRRRALMAGAATLVLVAVNGLGVVGLVWRNTDGFGLRGQATPWAAFDGLTATSCLSDLDFHWRGGHVVQADCPRGPDADYFAGRYDTAVFDDLVCGPQPASVFAKWWTWNRTYRIQFTLSFTLTGATVDATPVTPPYPTSVSGSEAQLTVAVELKSEFPLGRTIPLSGFAETWTVHARSARLGGWKVCSIDVTTPIVLTG
jgi:hypothetical protein